MHARKLLLFQRELEPRSEIITSDVEGFLWLCVGTHNYVCNWWRNSSAYVLVLPYCKSKSIVKVNHN